MSYQYGKLYLMIGPSGAGKSTWLKNSKFHPSSIISSDQIREELCGDFRDQTKNKQVFEAVRAIATARLIHGLPVVIDATHIKRADRLQNVALVPPTSPVTYIVLNRPLEEKRLTGGWRNELEIDLIGKHHNTFMSEYSNIMAGDSLPNVTVEYHNEAIYYDIHSRIFEKEIGQ